MARVRGASDAKEAVVIRDAACVVVIDETRAEPAILMGRRRADQVFLPSKWVFPGGRVEAADRDLALGFTGTFSPLELAAGIRPFAIAALRELSEETGLVVGDEYASAAAGSCAPAPHHLSPLARAVTPPGRVRRYDTWFFAAKRSSIVESSSSGDGELLDLGWFTLAEARRLDLPHITKLVLEDVASRLCGAVFSAGSPGDFPHDDVPYYYMDDCSFQRTLISPKSAPLPP